MAIFDFDHLCGVNWDQKLKLWKFKNWILQNALNALTFVLPMTITCDQHFSSIRRCWLELLSQKIPKWAKMGPEPKKTLSFLLAKVKNGKYPKAETWYPNSIDGWSYYRLCENLWMTFWAMVAISTQQKKFFGLIFQELCDFSRAIWKSWHWNLSIGIGIGIDIRI